LREITEAREITGAQATSALLDTLRPKATWTANIANFARRKPFGTFGAVVMVLLILIAALAPVIAPFDPYRVHVTDKYAGPGQEASVGGTFLLGTDHLGRDTFSRLVYGSRISLYVGLVSVAIGVTIGSVIGIVSGYFSGKFDLIVQRIVDGFMAFPPLILALTIMAVLGASLENVIIAVCVVLIPGAARLIRSRVLSLREMDYITAAKAVGCGSGRIMFRHILPNTLATYIVFATITLGWAIIVEASLSFLGLGTPPDVPSWGGMLALASRQWIEVSPWLVLFPALALSIVVIAFNVLGDSLRDILDPRLRGTN
jgi:peptide/nickel transport system permease protein